MSEVSARMGRLIVMGMVLFGAVQCTFFGKDDDPPSTGAGSTAVSRKDYEGRGSEACQDWQYAYCNYVAARCDFAELPGSMEDCLREYSSLMCNSDASAEECTSTLESMSVCKRPKDSCLLWDMVDYEAAVALCDDLAEALCRLEVELCGRDTTVKACTKKRAESFKCISVVGAYLEYDEVIADITNLTAECELDTESETDDIDGGIASTDAYDSDTEPCSYSDCMGDACNKACCGLSVCDKNFFDEDELKALFFVY